MNAQVDKFFAPVRELNALAVENVEKVIGIQMKYIEDSAKLGIESLKGAAAISDVDGLKDYLAKQAEVSCPVPSLSFRTRPERQQDSDGTGQELHQRSTEDHEGCLSDKLSIQ